MRPKHPHAAESGVGKHTARESEAPNSVPLGKSAWRTPTPKFGPGTARSRGLIVFRIAMPALTQRTLSSRRALQGSVTTFVPDFGSKKHELHPIWVNIYALQYDSLSDNSSPAALPPVALCDLCARISLGSFARPPSALPSTPAVGTFSLFPKTRTRPRL